MPEVQKPHINPVPVLKAWLDEPLEDRVMALVEDPSLLELVHDLIEQLEVARQALAEIAYDGPNPGLRRSEELQWASDVARLALASNPATKFHAFCKDGSLQPCEICVGSCGIEEAEEAAQSPASEPEAS